MMFMSTLKKRLPFWRWALLTVFSVTLFFVLYGVCQSVFLLKAGTLVRILFPVTASLLLLGAYALWCRVLEKRWPEEISFKSSGSGLAAGLAVGFLVFAGITGILALLGMYRIESVSPQWNQVAISLADFLLVACAEELIFRGFLFRYIDERYNTAVALTVSALVFGFIHIMNSGATVWSSISIAITAGLMLGLAYKASGDLWLPIGIHWAWNFTQGNIFGFNVSGYHSAASIFTAEVDGPDLFTGGAFGPEASIIAPIFGVALSIIFAFYWRLRRNQ